MQFYIFLVNFSLNILHKLLILNKQKIIEIFFGYILIFQYVIKERSHWNFTAI